MALTEIKTSGIADDAITVDKLANAINTERTANAAKSTNATHTGEVTGSGALTITADAVTGAKIADDTINSEHYVAGSIDLEHMSSESVDEDNLYISNAGSDGQFLQKQSGNNGGLTWATISSTPEGTAILSTGESGGSKFLREDGDGSCSWQPVSAFVTGMILIWSGAANAIPTGWVLCNGSNSTPDLRGKFVVGYHDGDTDYDVGDTGGAATVTLTTAQMPAHTHTGTTKGTAGSHSWTQFGAGRNDWNYPGENSRGSATTASTGGGAAHENRPPFYALCYIMKT